MKNLFPFLNLLFTRCIALRIFPLLFLSAPLELWWLCLCSVVWWAVSCVRGLCGSLNLSLCVDLVERFNSARQIPSSALAVVVLPYTRVNIHYYWIKRKIAIIEELVHFFTNTTKKTPPQPAKLIKLAFTLVPQS